MLAPTVIVGLGGAGSTICTKVSQHARNLKEHSRLRFVCIDTDINDLRQRKEEDTSVVQIQTSAPYTIESYLKLNTLAREKWFPNNPILDGKTPTEGAGQVRAISRLAFEEAINKGRLRALNDAIDDLFLLDGEAPAQAVRVIIVSSLAGGTGSGIILPVAQYIKDYLENHLNKSGSVIRGFFLLPEIFHKGKSADEIASINANAYAATRELDAFMRKGDGTLQETKYNNLEMRLPDPQTKSTVNLNVSPFNFCFLYDRRNANDLRLESYGNYLEEAANTIFAQALSGASSRSNSSEDNAIKTLIETGGRNRFCAAGSSLLVYPKDRIVDYIAGRFCITQMGEDWLTIDKRYEELLEQYQEEKKRDPNAEKPEKLDVYVSEVEGAEKGSFAYKLKAMVSAEPLEIAESEEREAASKVDEYTEALEAYVTRKLNSVSRFTDSKAMVQRQLRTMQTKQKGDTQEKAATALAPSLTVYIDTALELGSSLGRQIGYNLFRYTDNRTESKKGPSYPPYIEAYMVDDDGKFIHPNAVRYFLYALRKKLFAEQEELRNETAKGSAAYRKVKDPYDDEATPNKVETIVDKYGSKRGKKRVIKLKYSEDIANEIENSIFKKTESFAVKMMLCRIYDEAIDYLDKLNEAYESFYKCFPGYIERQKRIVAQIPHEFENGSGKATRFVCASQPCLDDMIEKFVSKDPDSEVNGEFSATIFTKMLEYSQMAKKPNASTYFRKLFEDDILGFYHKLLENQYSFTIDKDLLTALEDEVRIEHASEELDAKDIENYTSDIIEAAGRLAVPFLEEPMGPERHGIKASAYSKEVLLDGDPTRKDFIQKYIDQPLGGVVDPNISKYEILIYNAVYNLNPGDLKRFQRPHGNLEHGGDYYKAYMEIYHKLGPDLLNNRAVSPHLDRNWHLTKFMPDLDDANQELVDSRIARTFLWAMITGEIEQTVNPKHPHSGEVSYSPANSKKKEFIVSNGTFCDELYEVLDALQINPPQVELINNKFEKNLEKQKGNKVPLAGTDLIRKINWFNEEAALDTYYDKDQIPENETKFALKQFMVNEDLMKPSVFDLLYWLKVNMPVDEFYEDDFIQLIDNLLDLLRLHVQTFVSEEDVDAVCLSIIHDQFLLFLDNLANEKDLPKPRNRFFDKSVKLIRDRIDEKIDTEYAIKFRSLPTMKTLFEQKEKDLYSASFSKNKNENEKSAEAVKTES